MLDDPIVAEVRKAREEMMRRCDNDLGKLVKYLQRRRKETGLKTVRTHPRRIKAS